MSAHNFSIGALANRQQTPLTLEQIAHFAPSAMATSAHDSRSARYAFIPTVDVINAMMRNGFLPYRASQSNTRMEDRRGYTKHMIRFRHQSQDGLLRVGDVVPEISLVNSHDGSGLYELMAGLFRLACSNGLMVSESTLDSIKVRHTGDVVNNVIEGSFKLIESSTNVLATVNNWTRLQLTDGEQKVFAEAAHTVRFADAEGEVNTPITAAQLLAPRRTADTGSDLWKTFNRVQENTLRGGLRGVQRDETGRRIRRVTTREVKGIDQDVKLNRALWQLAEKMAELKAAA